MRSIGIFTAAAAAHINEPAFLGFTPRISFSEIDDPRKKVLPEYYELIRSDQISASAIAGQQRDPIRFEFLEDLLNQNLKDDIRQVILERYRLADVAKWHTYLENPERRLDRFLNYAATFLSTSRGEGIFQLSGSGSYTKIKVSPVGIEDRTRDLTMAKSAIQEAYHGALEKYGKSAANSEWEKEFRGVSRSVYEYRDDLVCGQVRVKYEAIREGLVSTQKYLNFRIPITFARVHILSSEKGDGPAASVARSDWTAASTGALEIVQLDASRTASVILGSEIMRESEESRNMTMTGCNQGEMISRDSLSDHCVHLGDRVSGLLRDQAASPGLTYALKCAALYPNKSIHLGRRYRQHVVGSKLELETTVIANFCVNGKWSKDIPLDSGRGSAVLSRCLAQNYLRPLEYEPFFNQVWSSIRTYNVSAQPRQSAD